MSKNDGPKLVVALFTFTGKNNDELCFKKGDIITITQLEDGGWWEGTLNDKTGWFPCNHVQEYKASDSGSSSSKLSPEKNSPESPVYPALNRDIVLKDIIDSERANVAELQNLYSHFLHPLETANILKKEEYKQLVGNFPDVLETHQYLLANLDNALSQGPEAKVGNIFLTLAPKLKSIHTTYCTYHPQAVCILDRFRDELNDYMERSGAITPGILVLTTGLSKPFRRLDKYSSMLQELERHTEKNHPDRGDTQRSVSVYREIADCCVTIRKQRELALQILLGGIKGWEGEELSALGDVIHVGPVILISGADRRDRYFVLFHKTLLVLSTSSRMSSFVYEGQLPLTGINIVPLEQSDELRNAFEISGPMIETITVLCPSRDERQHWMELIAPEQHLTSPTTTPTTATMPPAFSRNKSGSASMIHRSASGGSFARSTPATSSLTHSTSQSLKLAAAAAAATAAAASLNSSPVTPEHRSLPSPANTIKQQPWSVASLRPAPPIYCPGFNSTSKNSVAGKIDAADGNHTLNKPHNERQFEEDALILRVIEGYCMSANARFTLNSAIVDFEPPQKVNDRTSIANSRVGNSETVDDRYLSETVKILKGQMMDIQTQVAQLCKQLEEERKSRLSLAATVKRSMAVIDGTVP